MRWMALTPIVLLLAACNCCTKSNFVEYRQVTYQPPAIIKYRKIYTPTVTVATPPVYTYDPVTVINEEPIDVTTTRIDYY